MNLENLAASTFKFYKTPLRPKQIKRLMDNMKFEAKDFIEDVIKHHIGEDYDENWGVHAHIDGTVLTRKGTHHFNTKWCASDFAASQTGWKNMRTAIILLCESLKECHLRIPRPDIMIARFAVKGFDTGGSALHLTRNVEEFLLYDKSVLWPEMTKWLQSLQFSVKAFKMENSAMGTLVYQE